MAKTKTNATPKVEQYKAEWNQRVGGNIEHFEYTLIKKNGLWFDVKSEKQVDIPSGVQVFKIG